MRKETVLESDNEHERKLKAFGGVGGHQSDWSVSFILIGIRNESGVIYKLAQPFDALFIVIDGGIDEFLQIFQTRFGLVGLFGLERVLVTGFEDRGLDDV